MVQEYYLFCENYSLDSNQWSFLIGTIASFLTFFSLVFAYYLYNKQRQDNSLEAFIFFNESMNILYEAVKDTIKNLSTFERSLLNQNDNFSTPILSSQLNDKFLDRINLLDLKRYFTKEPDKNKFFNDLLVRLSFISDYNNYFTSEISFLRENFLRNEEIYNKWQLLRSNSYFTALNTTTDNNYKNFYFDWIKKLNEDEDVIDNTNPSQQKIKNRKILVEKHIDNLRKNIYEFIEDNENANHINLLANQVYNAFLNMQEIKSKTALVISRDIKYFKETLDLIEKFKTSKNTF